MMRSRLCFAGVAILAATSAAATDLPKSGAYAAYIYTGNPVGQGCFDSGGAIYAGVLNYDGLAGNRAGLRAPLKGQVSVQSLTVNAGLGTVTPSGTFTWKISTGQQSQNASGDWSAQLYVVDTFSFVAKITEHYNMCTEILTVSLTRIGPHET